MRNLQIRGKESSKQIVSDHPFDELSNAVVTVENLKNADSNQ
jgi:hypothetical protein